jgi:hypothetical protein
MSNVRLYEEIPLQILEQLGFPLNYHQLSLEQKDLIDHIFNGTAEIKAKLYNCREKVFLLEDRVADLEYELRDLAGEK